MTIVVSPTQSQVYTALRAFILAILPAGIPVRQGQQNRVSEPSSPDFVIMTIIRRERIATNTDTYQPAIGISTETLLQPTKVTIQIDVHGPLSTENAQLISTIARDDYGTDLFQSLTPYDVTPLYADDPKQIPFMNAESQWETRWQLDCVLQVNELVVAPQQFTDVIHVSRNPVDVGDFVND